MDKLEELLEEELLVDNGGDGGGVLVWLTAVVLDARGDLDLLLVEAALAVEAAVEAGFLEVLLVTGFLEKKEKRFPCFRLPFGGSFPFFAEDDMVGYGLMNEDRYPLSMQWNTVCRCK